MNLIKPQNLSPGDTIEIIAPSGAVEPEKIMNAKKYFEDKGFKVIFGEHIFNSDRYLAGTDEERIADLHNAFLNDEVKAIVCARGGYGAIRLINRLDFELIREHPKIFCGYSDITALSLMFLKYSNLITYSGPMAQSDFGSDNPDKTMESSFFKVLGGRSEVYEFKEAIRAGYAEGSIWGGNLSTLVSLCGLDFLPEQKFIFFTEDIFEPVYKLDKMFRQLINIEKFRENIQGIAFGEFGGIDSEIQLRNLMCEIADTLKVPAYSGFRFTHAPSKQTIPVGMPGILDGILRT